jgi:hypothetical protein
LAGSEILEGNPPKVITKAGLQALLRELYVQGKLDNLEFTTTAFNFLLPSGITLSDDTSATPAASVVSNK